MLFMLRKSVLKEHHHYAPFPKTSKINEQTSVKAYISVYYARHLIKTDKKQRRIVIWLIHDQGRYWHAGNLALSMS